MPPTAQNSCFPPGQETIGGRLDYHWIGDADKTVEAWKKPWMKQVASYIPLLAFFFTWAMDERPVSLGGFEHSFGGIYSAAEVLLVTSVVVYGALFLAYKRLDKFEWITLGAVVLFCIPTFLLRDINFLKWKAPLVNWIFAAVFLASRYIGGKPALQHMLGHAVSMPREQWLRLNNVWIAYFALLGAVNLGVAYGLSEAAWIQFKVFGNLVITAVFIFGQMPWLARYMETPEEAADESPAAKPGGSEAS